MDMAIRMITLPCQKSVGIMKCRLEQRCYPPLRVPLMLMQNRYFLHELLISFSQFQMTLHIQHMLSLPNQITKRGKVLRRPVGQFFTIN